MSAPKKAAPKKASHPSYKMMAMEAIAHIRHGGKGASRAAIANYVQKTYKIEAGGMFNASLRRALTSGCAAGVFAHGESAQRFKLTDAGRKARKDANKPKKVKKKKVVKKKTTKKKRKNTKKKTTKKKKKASKAKKKPTKAKKKTTKAKKKTTKKKTAPKRKAPAKKRTASKGKKKTASKKKTTKSKRGKK